MLTGEPCNTLTLGSEAVLLPAHVLGSKTRVAQESGRVDLVQVQGTDLVDLAVTVSAVDKLLRLHLVVLLPLKQLLANARRRLSRVLNNLNTLRLDVIVTLLTVDVPIYHT